MMASKIVMDLHCAFDRYKRVFSCSIIPGSFEVGLEKNDNAAVTGGVHMQRNNTSTQQILVLCQQWFGTYAGQGDFADDETLVSIRQFCDKSRESSLGGPIIRAQRMWYMAALHLLKEVIPTAIGSENGLLSLCSRPEELSQFPDVVELICWERYFEILREYLLWEEIYGAAVQNMLESDDKEESQKALLDLEHDTVSL
eukprot:jgi/Picre1/29995/NNA_005371.t1